MANTENRKNEELMNELNAEELGKVSGGAQFQKIGYEDVRRFKELSNDSGPVPPGDISVQGSGTVTSIVIP